MSYCLPENLKILTEKTLKIRDKEGKTGNWGDIYLRSKLKRTMDLTIAGGGIVPVMPVMVLCGAATLIDDGEWPPWILLPRHHTDREDDLVIVPKMRTMAIGSHLREGEVAKGRTLGDLAIEGDDRVTRVGKWMRRTSLDELPQLGAVLATKYWSMVGIRVLADVDWDIVKKRQGEDLFREYLDLLRTRPPLGITGMYGIAGRKLLKPEERAALDISYLKNASFMGDLRILAMTPRVVLKRTGAL